jgi:predicted GNAT superfamily acetyltransferase
MRDESTAAPDTYADQADAADTEVSAILVELPEDIESLRKTNLAEAREWRARVREVLEPALAEGYRVTGILNRQALVLELPTEKAE